MYVGAPGAREAWRKEADKRPDPQGLMGLVTNHRFFPKSIETALKALNLNRRHDCCGSS